MAVCWLLLGLKVYDFQQDKIADERLQSPAQTKVQFVSAKCRFKSGNNSPIYLSKTYTYQTQPDSQNYEVEDLIRYPSMAQCEADLPKANTFSLRQMVWFDQTQHAKASWDLEEASPATIFWFFGIGILILLTLGVAGLRHKRS
ncbi:hypothetical protein H8K33_12390 [Undibacterium amnicola]|uniref:DUF3592 domain-containing protein n=1 Tax=Undibacterium amnicola TaxID=1834038 RepID=A0ABR6XTI8_9BURK|nr:hypothetical protein [Undibacterium amnicola]MBC3832314.1 hypothetical protein [Undibacterium amnicola]